MARYADFGLMIWDGQSPGTLLNVLRLVSSGKMTVLIDAPAGKTHTLKDSAEWRTFLADLSPATRTAIGRRAVGAERQWLAEAPTAGLFAHGAT